MNPVKKILKDTGEFAEEDIEDSAEFVSGFTKLTLDAILKLPDISYLFKKDERE